MSSPESRLPKLSCSTEEAAPWSSCSSGCCSKSSVPNVSSGGGPEPTSPTGTGPPCCRPRRWSRLSSAGPTDGPGLPAASCCAGSGGRKMGTGMGTRHTWLPFGLVHTMHPPWAAAFASSGASTSMAWRGRSQPCKGPRKGGPAISSLRRSCEELAHGPLPGPSHAWHLRAGKARGLLFRDEVCARAAKVPGVCCSGCARVCAGVRATKRCQPIASRESCCQSSVKVYAVCSSRPLLLLGSMPGGCTKA